MITEQRIRRVQSLISVIAILFGVVTVFAGGRVLLGGDPGYAVFKALLVFNSVMGVAYVLAGLTIWRELAAGKKAAGIVSGLNFLVLIGIVLVYLTGGGVAVDSLYAMTFRTAIWLGFFLALLWLARHK